MPTTSTTTISFNDFYLTFYEPLSWLIATIIFTAIIISAFILIGHINKWRKNNLY